MFGWLKEIFNRSTSAISLVSPWLRGVAWTISRNFLVLAREGYGNNSIVYACLRLLSQSVPEPPLLVYQVDSKLERVQAPFNHPLQALSRTPNPLQTEYAMMELITLQLGVVGRSHWWKQRDNIGRIKYLWPLRPDRVGPWYGGEGQDQIASQVKPLGDGEQNVLLGWNYWQPGLGEPIQIPLSEIVTFSHPDPAGETGGVVEGMGPLQVLNREVESDNEATNYVGALLKNHATPGTVLQLKQSGISREQAQKAKRIFANEFGGSKRGEPAVIDGDTTITELGFNMQQLEFPNLRHMSETRITASYGVPAILVGLDAGLKSGIRATIAEMREYFTETTLANYWRMISDTFTQGVASEFGEALVVRFDTSQVKALAVQGRYEVSKIQQGFQMGAVTIDEYRVKALGLQPLPAGAGDVTLLPQGVTPSTDQLNEAVEANFQGDEATPVEVVSAKHMRVLPRHKAAPVRYQSKHAGKTRSQRDARTEATISRYAPRIHDALQLMQASVQLHLPELVAAQKDDAVPVVDPDAAAQLTQVVAALQEDVLRDAYTDAGDTLGLQVNFDLYNESIQDVVASLGQRITGINDTTRQAVVNAIDRGLRDGLSMDDLAAAVMGSGIFGESRARMIARTESGTAYNRGSISAYRASGVVDKVEVMDGRHDGPCASADGAIWTLDHADSDPLAHPNCIRCFSPITDIAGQEAA